VLISQGEENNNSQKRPLKRKTQAAIGADARALLVPVVRVTRVRPILVDLKMEGALTSYHSFLVKGSMLEAGKLKYYARAEENTRSEKTTNETTNSLQLLLISCFDLLSELLVLSAACQNRASKHHKPVSHVCLCALNSSPTRCEKLWDTRPRGAQLFVRFTHIGFFAFRVLHDTGRPV
jgi:hypothetical protein